MAANEKISGLTAAGALTGAELVEVVQGGVNKKTTSQDIADLGGGGGAVTSVNGQTGAVTGLGQISQRIDQNNSATTSAQLAATISDEIGTGALVFESAMTAAIAAAQVGLWDDRGTFSAAGGAYPSSGGSGSAGAILKGDIWTISTGGTLPTGQVVEIGDTVRALIDTPGNTQANWAILQNNIGFVPAPIASPTFTGTPAAPTAAQGTNTTQVATTAFVQTEVATKYDFLVTLLTFTASHTLDSTDLASVNAGDQLVIRQNSASANNLEIPLNATIAFPVGTIIGIRNINTGIVTITAVIGVTLTSPLSAFNLSNQWDMAYIEKTGTNTWVANGQLSL